MRWLLHSMRLPDVHATAAGVRTRHLIRAAAGMGVEVHFASPARLRDDVVQGMYEDGLRKHHRCPVNDATASAAVMQEAAPDVVVFDSFYSEEFFGHHVRDQQPDCLRVLDMQDVHSLRLARQRLVLEEGGSIAAASRHVPGAHDPTLARELAAVLRSDLTLVCGSAEIELLRGRFGVTGPNKLLLAPLMGLDHGQAPQAARSFGERANFVTIGNFRHLPNRDSVAWLRHEVWPLLRERLARARMHCFGTYMDKASSELEDPGSGFLMRGRLDDLARLGKYRAMLAPLRFGAGIKGKVVDAWRFGTPVVTTPIGAESLEDVCGEGRWAGSKHCVTAEEIVDEAVRLHSSEDRWEDAHAACATGLRNLTSQFGGSAAAVVESIVRKRETMVGDREQDYLMGVIQENGNRAAEFKARMVEALATSQSSPSS